jgi:hypothetical protein
MAVIRIQPLNGCTATVKGIKYLCKRYRKDIPEKLLQKKPVEFFGWMKNIKYTRDTKPVEVIIRPKWLLSPYGLIKGMDCKKKATVTKCYLDSKKLKNRLVLMSNRPDKKMHHILNQVKTKNGWKNFDTTYSHNRPFQPRKVTRYYAV